MASMSLSEDGCSIRCNGPGCQAVADAPVALRSVLSARALHPRTIVGWLYVADGERCLHFCPRCAPRYLEAISLRAIGE